MINKYFKLSSLKNINLKNFFINTNKKKEIDIKKVIRRAVIKAQYNIKPERNTDNNIFLKKFSLYFSLFIYFSSLLLWLFFDESIYTFQFLYEIQWLNFLNITFLFGIDSISLFLVVLTTFLTFLCILSTWNSINEFVGYYYSLFFLLEFLILIVFTSLDVLVFYIFFEIVLIPMFLIIGNWGSRERKIRAGTLFFIYTLFGSFFMLLSILIILILTGTLNYITLMQLYFDGNIQKLLWLGFFISFIIKVPSVPLHLWLPEAHVEAPTSGSVILAGLLLKLGSYGLIRFSLGLFPEASIYFAPLVYVIGIISILYASFNAIRQIDIKRIIAYSSIAHMNLVLIGIFSNNIQAIEGSIFQMLSHGLVSSALFLSIGILYDRTHTRSVSSYSGIVQTMPLFVVFFAIFTLANIAFPGTSSFIGEFLLLVGILQKNYLVCLFSMLGVLLAAVYALWLFNRVSFLNIKSFFIYKFIDLSFREFFILFILSFFIILLGIYPSLILNVLHISSLFIFF